MGPQVPGEGAGVDLADADHPRLFQVAVQLARGSPGRGLRGGLTHHEAGHLRPDRLDVVAVHAVVADVRIGHGDDLARVGRIGEDLLVAAHGGIEDDLPGRLAGGAEGAPLEDQAVLQGKGSPGAIHTHDS